MNQTPGVTEFSAEVMLTWCRAYSFLKSRPSPAIIPTKRISPFSLSLPLSLPPLRQIAFCSPMDIPVIDLAPYLEIAGRLSGNPAELYGQLGASLAELCREVSRLLRETGALVVKDPRCSAEDNDRFIDMMEKYFEQPEEFKRLQERPNLHYQVSSISINLFLDQEKKNGLLG